MKYNILIIERKVLLVQSCENIKFIQRVLFYATGFYKKHHSRILKNRNVFVKLKPKMLKTLLFYTYIYTMYIIHVMYMLVIYNKMCETNLIN